MFSVTCCHVRVYMTIRKMVNLIRAAQSASSFNLLLKQNIHVAAVLVRIHVAE